MKRITAILIIPLMMIIIFSCKKGEAKQDQEKIKFILEALEIKKEVKWVILLPGLGCDGCIKEGEYFLKQYINNENMFLVLTNIKSLKILQHKLGIKLTNLSNVYADKENRYGLTTDNKIYPCIVHLNNGQYESHEFQSPMNGNAFEKLATRILIE